MGSSREDLAQFVHAALIRPDVRIEPVDRRPSTFTLTVARAPHTADGNVLDTASVIVSQLQHHVLVLTGFLRHYLRLPVVDFPAFRKFHGKSHFRVKELAASYDAILWAVTERHALEVAKELVTICAEPLLAR